MKKVAVLGIDLQNDFTQPFGALYVNGAVDDTKRGCDFIKNNQQQIDYIALTLDSHQPVHIAHQCYWSDKRGEHPPLFSTINVEDVESGKWIAQYNKDRALVYLKELAKNGDICTIWPMHCILGTKGWGIDQSMTDTLAQWSIDTGKSYELFYKGYAQNTEHYSIFKAAVEYDDQPDTHLNTVLLNKLNLFDELLICGQAADYCVVSSLNDILDNCAELAKKSIIFTDCMSWIIPNNAKANAIFDKAKIRGVRFMKSTEY